MVATITRFTDKKGDFVYRDQDGNILRRSSREYGFAAWHDGAVVSKFNSDDDRAHITFHGTREAAAKKPSWGKKVPPLVIYRIEGVPYGA